MRQCSQVKMGMSFKLRRFRSVGENDISGGKDLSKTGNVVLVTSSVIGDPDELKSFRFGI